MILASFAMAASLASDNIPYHYVGRGCSAQGDGHQPVFSGMSLDECEEVAQVDRRLNGAYRRALARLSSVRKIHLRNVQRDWITATNKKCGLLPDGTIAFSSEADCFIREAVKRTAELTREGSRGAERVG